MGTGNSSEFVWFNIKMFFKMIQPKQDQKAFISNMLVRVNAGLSLKLKVTEVKKVLLCK